MAMSLLRPPVFPGRRHQTSPRTSRIAQPPLLPILRRCCLRTLITRRSLRRSSARGAVRACPRAAVAPKSQRSRRRLRPSAWCLPRHMGRRGRRVHGWPNEPAELHRELLRRPAYGAGARVQHGESDSDGVTSCMWCESERPGRRPGVMGACGRARPLLAQGQALGEGQGTGGETVLCERLSERREGALLHLYLERMPTRSVSSPAHGCCHRGICVLSGDYGECYASIRCGRRITGRLMEQVLRCVTARSGTIIINQLIAIRMRPSSRGANCVESSARVREDEMECEVECRSPRTIDRARARRGHRGHEMWRHLSKL